MLAPKADGSHREAELNYQAWGDPWKDEHKKPLHTTSVNVSVPEDSDTGDKGEGSWACYLLLLSILHTETM